AEAAPVAPARPATAPNASPGTTPAAPVDPHAARRRLYARLVTRAVDGGDHPPARRELATRLAQRAEAAVLPGTPTAGDLELDRQFAEFLADTLALRGPDAHDYLSGTTGYSPEEPTGLRHLCGYRLLRLRVVSREVPGGTLALLVCERCGTAHTLPPTARPPRLSVTADALTLTFPEPLRTGGWYAAARQPIGGRPEAKAPVRPLAPGTTRLTVPLPADRAPGLRRFAVAVVADGDLGIHQLPLVNP
ncbi:hypothetical protein, partial [Kitasatospora sp. LaBMicrA B282]|uniref:hypothetical protein n=1 Tax=Kitasatospora sp. LaBMicrA B282 TaxID=3420949 RepID=UPI003D0B34AA